MFKLLRTFVAMLVAVAVIAGCQKEDATANPDDNGDQPQAEQPADVPEEPADPTEGELVE